MTAPGSVPELPDIRQRPLWFNPSLLTVPFEATACVVGPPPATAMGLSVYSTLVTVMISLPSRRIT
jgi:hypothetical protein